MPHRSDSEEQRAAELYLVKKLSRRLGIDLRPTSIDLRDGVRVAVDGFNRKLRVMCEAYAHIGKTRGSQPHKIARDILKMLALERYYGGKWCKVLCFADKNAAGCAKGRSWLAEVLTTFNVKVEVVRLSPRLHAAVVAAQLRQTMVNPS